MMMAGLRRRTDTRSRYTSDALNGSYAHHAAVGKAISVVALGRLCCRAPVYVRAADSWLYQRVSAEERDQ